ncbi:Asp hemolysin [Leucogyrophana mollusca]|uniref:Asp hemolysin n=1 Tax=Leucogyrophana mollusca TaxID=85980 RepID=A0ACB8AYI7_9AGAM|nr:Asp hemolysin [Leucogyrophana mollusca]
MADANYGQIVVLLITNSLESHPLKIQNAKLVWGKFIKDGNPDFEIPAEDIDKIVIPAGSKQSVSSCGRLGSAPGVEGTIDLYDDKTQVCTLYWNYPWSQPTLDFEVRDVNKAYNVTYVPPNAVLGSIAIDVALKG